MTDRPRTWKLACVDNDGRDIVDGPELDFSDVPIRVVEWDRRRVVPIIKQAQHEWATHFAAGGTRPLSDFVFDAIKEASDGAE